MPEIRHYTCDGCHAEWRFKIAPGEDPVVMNGVVARQEEAVFTDCPRCGSDDIACYRTDPYAAKAKPKGRDD